MFDIALDKIFEMLKLDSGTVLHNILLLLIWLNVRELKNLISALEISHNKRLADLETVTGKHESRILALEK